MIAAVDVHYNADGSAIVGAVEFKDYTDSEANQTYTCQISGTEPYVPGQFYKRELPCLLAVLKIIEEEIDTVIIDGYVDPGEKPGLGRHLWDALVCKTEVIGVAKKYFRGSDAIRIYRGKSRQPLYITSAGIEPSQASNHIEQMHGKFRIPDLLRLADSLCRTGKSG